MFPPLRLRTALSVHCVSRYIRQATTVALSMVICLAVFIGLERMVVPTYHMGVEADAAIPFIPSSWLIYILFFPFVIAVAAFSPAPRFRTFMQAGAIAYLLALVCFWLLPERLPRPDPLVIENAFLRERLSRLWALDLPSNGFPSLHVAITLLACRMWAGYRHALWVFVVGALICLSTLTTKQHTLIDVAGGVALAFASAQYVDRRRIGRFALDAQ